MSVKRGANPEFERGELRRKRFSSGEKERASHLLNNYFERKESSLRPQGFNGN